MSNTVHGRPSAGSTTTSLLVHQAACCHSVGLKFNRMRMVRMQLNKQFHAHSAHRAHVAENQLHAHGAHDVRTAMIAKSHVLCSVLLICADHVQALWCFLQAEPACAVC